MRKINLVIIDPNKDFVLPTGALSVPNADKAADRIAELIDRAGDKFNIKCTLDSHHEMHIAHSPWFVDKNGNNPPPFTLLKAEDNKIVSYDPATNDITGEYHCNIPGQETWTMDYLKSLGPYPHCIWPGHCIIGTDGHGVYDHLREAMSRWCYKEKAVVDFITKGSNPRTEHFSAVKAQVVDPTDPSTDINSDFISDLQNSDELAFCGFATNFCFLNTLRDIYDIAPEVLNKCVVLEDCIAEIPGFDHLTEEFNQLIKKSGASLVRSNEYL